MKAKHTPGPWDWFTHHGEGNEILKSSDGEPRMKFLLGSDGQGFAHTVGLSEPQDTANADLIASAPALLEALKGVVKELSMWPGDKNPEFFPGMQAARALIEKLEDEDS